MSACSKDNGMTNINRKLDWKSYHDERSRSYSVRPILDKRKIEIKRVMWDEGVVLDQGSEGACVGFGWMAELLAAPAQPKQQPEVSSANRIAQEYYKRAQKIDEWPGENYEGTSVLAGAKIVKEEGFISGYRWCFNIEDIRDSVISEGPVVIGVPWRKGMYKTANNGLVQITGPVVGGHCLTITGYDPAMKIGNNTYEVFRWRNSWGTEYGINGSGYIKKVDLEKLLAGTGEACVPIGRKEPVFKNKSSVYLFVSRLFNR